MAFDLSQYETVAERLAQWLATTEQTAVETTMLSAPGADVCVFKATLYVAGVPVATGHAEEIRGQGNVNRTSHVENCETSAVGRALANLGMAGSDPARRPSREEMAKVVRQTTSNPGAASTPVTASADGVRIKGKVNGPIPPWLVEQARAEGVDEVYDNRDTATPENKRPHFKAVQGGKGFWPPRGRKKDPDPTYEPADDEEEPF